MVSLHVLICVAYPPESPCLFYWILPNLKGYGTPHNPHMLCHSVFVWAEATSPILMLGSSIRPTLRPMLCRRLELYMPRGKSGVGGSPDWPVDKFVFSALFFGNPGEWLSSRISPLLVSDFISIYWSGFQSREGSLTRDLESVVTILRLDAPSPERDCFSCWSMHLHTGAGISPPRSVEGPDNSCRSRSQVLFLRFLWVHRSRAESHIFMDNWYALFEELLTRSICFRHPPDLPADNGVVQTVHRSHYSLSKKSIRRTVQTSVLPIQNAGMYLVAINGVYYPWAKNTIHQLLHLFAVSELLVPWFFRCVLILCYL